MEGREKSHTDKHKETWMIGIMTPAVHLPYFQLIYFLLYRVYIQ
jgi:hypothetical protein